MLQRGLDALGISRPHDDRHPFAMRLAQALDVADVVEDERLVELDRRVPFGRDLRHAPAGSAEPALAH